MPQVPFAFEFESERPNGNSATKQSPNHHSTILEKSVKWLKVKAIWPFDPLYPNLMNVNLATVLSPNYHSAVQTQTQTQPEVFRKQQMCMFYSTQLQ